MKTLYNYPYPMTDGALRHVPHRDLALAMINHACRYCSLHPEVNNTPCWVFHELGIGMDHSLRFVIIDFVGAGDTRVPRHVSLTNSQAYRLIEMYRYHREASLSSEVNR